MTEPRDHLSEEAIGWAVRLRQADAADWQAFTHWLEVDPAHLKAYEEVAAIDAELDGLPKQAERPLPAAGTPRRPWAAPRRAVIGWGVAAALVAILGYGSLQGDGSTYMIETGPGERRTIALAEGSRIDLNGSSKITLDRDDPRFSRLEQGEALFHVVHNPSTTFRVEVGDAVIRDLGTVFNVVHEDGVVRLGVAEGAVSFTSGGYETNLSPGDTLRQAGGRIDTAHRDPSQVGTWRKGELSYSSASIAEVAADLSRNTGLAVRASPEVARRQFSGNIVLTASHPQLLERVSALLGVEARRAGEGWTLTAEGR